MRCLKEADKRSWEENKKIIFRLVPESRPTLERQLQVVKIEGGQETLIGTTTLRELATDFAGAVTSS